MDFEPNELQESLADAVRSICAGRFPMTVVRSLGGQAEGLAARADHASPRGEERRGKGAVDRELWKTLAETGVFSLRRPEGDRPSDGLGLSLADAAIVFEQLGRALVPGPLVATHLAATHLDPAGRAALHPDPEFRLSLSRLAASAASGDVVVGLVEAEPGPIFIEHLDGLDVLLVLDDAGVRRVDAEEIRALASPVSRPIDPCTPLHEIAFLPLGERIGDEDLAIRMRADGSVLTSALMVGLAGASLDLANAYAKQREQFGKPIGMFQAVKHILADMFVRFDLARAAVHAAAVLSDDPDSGDPIRAMHGAKIQAIDAAVLNGKAGIQVHGGMGFTWEVDAQLFLKRAWVLETHFGSADVHAEALSRMV